VFSPVAAGNYTVEVKDGANCLVSTPVTVGTSPTPTSILQVFNITTSSAVVQWAGVPPFGGVTYSLRYRIAGSASWTLVENLTTTSRFVTGLQNATTYEVEVNYRCPNDGPEGGFSSGLIHEFTTLPEGTGSCAGANPPAIPVPVPGGVFIDGVTATSATVHWNRVPGAIGYIISWGLSNVNPATWPQVIVCDPIDAFTMTGLTSGSDYDVRVRTNCSNCITALNANDLRSVWSTLFRFVTSATRLDVASSASGVTVYPNPTRGSFTARWSESGPATLTLMDVQGRTLWQTTGATSGTPVRLSGYAAGVYVLTVETETESHRVKVVLQD
jgi:hypothetical protein